MVSIRLLVKRLRADRVDINRTTVKLHNKHSELWSPFQQTNTCLTGRDPCSLVKCLKCLMFARAPNFQHRHALSVVWSPAYLAGSEATGGSVQIHSRLTGGDASHTRQTLTLSTPPPGPPNRQQLNVCAERK